MNKNPLLTVIIVTYNNENEIIPCLTSLPWLTVPMEIIVVDSHSSDRTREKAEDFMSASSGLPLSTFWCAYNAGYAKCVNLGLRQSRGQYIMLLGADTVLQPGSVQILIDFFKKRKEAGMVAPQLIASNAEILPSCRRFPTYGDIFMELTGLPRLFPNRIQPAWKMSDFNHTVRKKVDQPEASCVMITREALEDVGFMDERFTIFFNDVDWCRRFNEKNWKIWFYPEAKVIHKKGVSIHSARIPMIWKSHQGIFRYFRKYHSAGSLNHLMNSLLLCCLIWTAALRTLFLFLFSRNS